MSSVFLKEIQRNMDEDAKLTEQRPRQFLQEDRSSEQEDMTPEQELMPIETEDKAFEQEDMMMETDFQEEPEGDMNFIFDGLLEAMRRRSSKE